MQPPHPRLLPAGLATLGLLAFAGAGWAGTATWAAAAPMGLLALAVAGAGQDRIPRGATLVAALLAALGALVLLGREPVWSAIPLVLLAESAALLLRWGPAGGQADHRFRQAASLLALSALVPATLALEAAAGGLGLLYGGRTPLLPPLPAMGLALLAGAQLLQGGWDVWPLAVFRVSPPEASRTKPQPASWRPLGLFLTLCLLILGAGALFLRSSAASTRSRVHQELDAVAHLKLQLLERWQTERLKEAERLGRSPLVQALLAGYLAGGPGAPSQAEVLAWMRAPLNGETRAVGLYDATGRLRLLEQAPGSTNFQPGPQSEALPWIQAAQATGRTQFQPLHQHGPGGALHVGLWVPVGHPFRGALLLMTDPWPFLNPLLHAWIGLHPGTRTLLISSDSPSSSPGAHDGYGADGRPEVAAAYPVADSPWTLEVAGSQSILYHGARLQAWAFEAALLGLCGLMALAIGMVLRQRGLAQSRDLLRLNGLYTALTGVSQAIALTQGRQALLDQVCRALAEAGGFALAWIAQEDPDTRRVLPLARWGDVHGLLDRVVIRTDDSPEGQGAVGTALREGHPCLVNDYLRDPASRPWRAELGSSSLASIAAFPVRAPGEAPAALVVYSHDPDCFGPDEARLLEGAATDLSLALARRADQAALVDSEARFRTLSDTMAAAVFIYQGDRFVLCNAAFERMTGYPRAEVAAGLRIQDLVHPEDWPLVLERARARQAGEEATSRYDFRIRTREGRIRWVDFTAGRILWQGRPAGVGTAYDITDRLEAEEARRTLEAQLQQSQKLESLGSLAGGVAHDMNNVLGAILSLASTLQAQAGTDGALAKSLDTIAQACTRGRGVVKSLLYFARKDLAEDSPVDLNALVQEMGQLLSYTTLKRIHLEMELAEGLDPLRGDAGALSHALLNLCVNACDAMPGGGTLRLRTEPLPTGGVRIRVQDTGAGMDPEVLAHCQEPFFTTKPKGQGTGLGLSMVHSTMRAHGGTLVLSSDPGQGTEAILDFPPDRMLRAAPGHAPLEAAPQTPAGLHILLVDDDPLIRESVQSVLELLNHHVTEAPGGTEALQLLEQGLPVDLVILDMNMPGMSGAQALPRILALRPLLRVLLASGYSDEDIAPLVAADPRVHSLQKPFSMKELDRKLRDLWVTP